MPDKLSAERAGRDESRKNIQIIPDSSQYTKQREHPMFSRNTKYILMILVITGFIGIGLVIEQSSAIGFSLLAYCLGLVIGLRSAVALISLNTGKTRRHCSTDSPLCRHCRMDRVLSRMFHAGGF